jgi:hypothetical protein
MGKALEEAKEEVKIWILARAKIRSMTKVKIMVMIGDLAEGKVEVMIEIKDLISTTIIIAINKRIKATQGVTTTTKIEIVAITNPMEEVLVEDILLMSRKTMLMTITIVLVPAEVEASPPTIAVNKIIAANLTIMTTALANVTQKAMVEARDHITTMVTTITMIIRTSATIGALEEVVVVTISMVVTMKVLAEAKGGAILEAGVSRKVSLKKR